jgi:hypothetical protein
MELSQRSNKYSTNDLHQTIDLENQVGELHEQFEQPISVYPTQQNSVIRSNVSFDNNKNKRDLHNPIKNIINLDKKLLSM